MHHIGTDADREERRSQEHREENDSDEQQGEVQDITSDEEYCKQQEWMQYYGEERNRNGTHEQDIVRFVTQNVNSFPRIGTIKSLRLQEELQGNDCVGMSELNKNWFKVNAQDSLYNRMTNWWKTQKTKMTWLREYDWHSEYQQGGVSLTLAKDKLSKYGKDKGEDMSGLGRWVWQTIEGHSNIKTVIIQVYRPVKNEKDNGSTYMQQRAASDESDPIKIFDNDLIEVIDTFIHDNFRIVVMGDFNTALNGSSRLERALNRRGIYDAIQQRYGQGQSPNSHKRGTHTIDGIFISETVQMIRGGYDGGQDEVSDHRLVWVDLEMDSILGTDRGDLVRPKGKKLQTTNVARTTRYNKLLMEQIRNHRLLQKAKQLDEEIGERKYMTNRQKQTYEGIDNQRCRAVAHSEEKCVRLPKDGSEFSVELKRAMGEAIIWQQIEKRIQKNLRVHNRWIIDMKERLGVEEFFEITDDKEEVKKKSKEAWEKYKEAKKKSPELRSQFLDLMIRQAEDKGDTKKVKDLREIKEREQTKDIYKRIQFAQGKTMGGGVRFVQKINDNGEIETIKEKHEMEREIMQANAAKLQSANESPIRQGALNETITDSNYDQWERLLKGEVAIPPESEEGTRKWLSKFSGTRIEEEEISLTVEEYTKSWNRVKEHTSCAPGALHYGVFKAMRWNRESAELYTIMAKIPIQTGYVPKRWKISTDSMLPKKPNEWRPSKLRLTSLLMPDFNHNNKILGRAAMKWAERKKLLAPEQYGSRKKLSAAKHALNKRLMLDILRQQRRPGVLCANDAKACYDRILHFAAYVSLRKAGLKREAVISMLEPIRKLKHFIRTAYGDSNTAYGGDEWERDPSGICQGNGAGPAIWALVSSPLLDVLRESGYGAKLHAAIGKTYLHLSGFAFVDDADTIQTGNLGETTTTVLNKAQKELDLWEECIRATGGGLEGEKSDFAVINFTWKSGTWSYEKKDENNQLTVRNQNGGRDPLEQLAASKARRTLGVWQAIDGNEKTQTNKMREKSSKWSRAVARSSLNRNDTIVGIKTTLYPSVTFGVMATTLDKEQCERVFKPIRAGALSKAGYAKSIPAVVVHGPKKYGGIGLKDIHSIQGIEHIKAIIDEAGTKSPTAELINIVIDGHILEVGRSGSIFEHKYSEIEGLLTKTWIQNTLEFVGEHRIKIEGNLSKLETWRERDELLMDAVAGAQGATITNEDMIAFNRCRQYLRVTTISDICTGGGTHILKSAWEVYRDWKSLSSQAYKWPFQPRPEKEDKQAWRRVLQQVYGVEARYRSIPHRLGAYHKKSRHHASWYIDRQNDSLYQRVGRRWKRWHKIIRRTRSRQYSSTEEYEESPARQWDIATVTTTPTGMTAVFEGNAAFTQHNQEQTIIDTEGDTDYVQQPTLEMAIQQIPRSLQWAVEKVQIPEDDGRAIAAMIIEDRGKCVCDGSLKDKMGTAAGVPMGVTEEKKYIVMNRTPGATSDQNSFRSELCGILANILIMQAIVRHHGIEKGTITLACDNESALWMAFGAEHVTTGDSSFDIIRVIKKIIDDSQITWRHKHVKGHQDEDEDRVLDEWAIANVEVDRLADEYWTEKYSHGIRLRPQPPRMPGEGWRVLLDERPLVANVDEQLYDHIHYDRCVQYWTKKGRLAENMGANVDWAKYGGAIKTMPKGKQQWVQKHFCGFEGTNQMLNRWNQRTTSTCPSCAEQETHRHILRCQSNRATTAYRTIERNFEDWLKRTTSNDIRITIMHHLTAYREEEPIHEPDHWKQEIAELSRSQKALGPCAFVEGFLVKEWEHMQRQHLDETKSKRHPGRWVRELIKKVWMVSWDMWESRNEEVHKVTTTRKAQIIAQLDKDIRDQHSLGRTNNFLPRVERRFFQQPVLELLRQTEYQKRTWLHIAGRFIDRDRQRVARSRSIQIMREYFDPGSTVGIVRHRQRIINRHDTNPRTPSGTRRGIRRNRD